MIPRTAKGVVLALMVTASCVPADEALGLGATQFVFGVSQATATGITAKETADGFAVVFDRLLLGFKTMTIGKVGAVDTCSYRGRAQRTDVVLDPRFGLVQAFNGITPVECPDVGLIFGSPEGSTTLGDGVGSKDLVELATGRPAHAIVEATATRARTSTVLKIAMRFDTALTATRFGGCQAGRRGVRILAGERDEARVLFAAENLFRDAIAIDAPLRGRPFAQADEQGNQDGIVTMAELDGLRLLDVVGGEFYQLADGTRRGSFGDYVRALFRFTIKFRDETGLCIGNEPGVDEGG